MILGGSSMGKDVKTFESFEEHFPKMVKLKPVIFFRPELEFDFAGVGYHTIYDGDAEAHTLTVVVNQSKADVFHMVENGLKIRMKGLFKGLFNTQHTLSDEVDAEALRNGLRNTEMQCYIGIIKPDSATIRTAISFRFGEYYDFSVIQKGMKFRPNSFVNLLVPELMQHLTALVDDITKQVTE